MQTQMEMDSGGVEARDYLARSWWDMSYTSYTGFFSSLLAGSSRGMPACPTVREWPSGLAYLEYP